MIYNINLLSNIILKKYMASLFNITEFNNYQC